MENWVEAVDSELDKHLAQELPPLFENVSGPKLLAAAVLGGAVGTVFGAGVGFCSLFFLIDGLVIDHVRFSAGGQIAAAAILGGLFGAAVWIVVVVASSKPK